MQCSVEEAIELELGMADAIGKLLNTKALKAGTVLRVGLEVRVKLGVKVRLGLCVGVGVTVGVGVARMMSTV